MQVEAEEPAGHSQRGAPLACARFGGKAFQTLLFRVVGLRDGGVELMGTGRVVAFEFVENLRGRTESLFEELRVHERGRTVHPVEFAHRFGNRNITVGGIELLPCQLDREHRRKVVHRHRLERGGVEHRRMVGLHVSAQVVVVRRQLFFGQIRLVLGARSHGHLHLLSRGRRRQ